MIYRPIAPDGVNGVTVLWKISMCLPIDTVWHLSILWSLPTSLLEACILHCSCAVYEGCKHIYLMSDDGKLSVSLHMCRSYLCHHIPGNTWLSIWPPIYSNQSPPYNLELEHCVISSVQRYLSLLEERNLHHHFKLALLWTEQFSLWKTGCALWTEVFQIVCSVF
jgi:hypothetical protein